MAGTGKSTYVGAYELVVEAICMTLSEGYLIILLKF